MKNNYLIYQSLAFCLLIHIVNRFTIEYKYATGRRKTKQQFKLVLETKCNHKNYSKTKQHPIHAVLMYTIYHIYSRKGASSLCAYV